MNEKIRLDVAIVAQGLAPSRAKAQALIEAGHIHCKGKLLYKSSDLVDPDVELVIKGETLRYVSRGGFKLEKALTQFGIDANDKVCLDAGASTGGFTDCLLQAGARRVYAIDVGQNQLIEQLRNDKRVISLERLNVRMLSETHVPELVDLITADLSFISLRLVLPALQERLKNSGDIICLVKPQFEAGRASVGKRGVVRDKKTHITVLKQFILDVQESRLFVKALDYSPIRGPEGNIEYLAWLTKTSSQQSVAIKELVTAAHTALEDNQ